MTTQSQALALYERACQTHKRADWRMACHALAAVLQGDQPKPPAKPKAERPAKADTLLGFLSRRGMIDTGGELKARGLHLWHREGPFRRRLIRDNGLGLDDAAQAAWEAGYFPDAVMPTGEDGDTYEAVTPAQLLDAMSDEYTGRAVRFPGEAVANEPEFDADAYAWAMQAEAA